MSRRDRTQPEARGSIVSSRRARRRPKPERPTRRMPGHWLVKVAALAVASLACGLLLLRSPTARVNAPQPNP